MSMKITEKCVGCYACYNVCPNRAIAVDPDAKPSFAIHPKRCNECVDQFDSRQCGEICPVEEAITSNDRPLNPVGSLQPVSALQGLL